MAGVEVLVDYTIDSVQTDGKTAESWTAVIGYLWTLVEPAMF
jgi:hypothetical protein